ncbi:MAG: BMP family protein [Clostridia bacterium]
MKLAKKWMTLIVVIVLAVSAFAGCKASTEPVKTEGKSTLKVGMISNATTVDDKSFNQATWEGVKKACEEYKLEHTYMIANSPTTADFIAEIDNLYDSGYRLIITPGYTFANAIFEAQTKYPDCNFVILDSQPSSAETSETLIADNTAAIDFAAQQSGFIAGVAVAVQLKEGEWGALFGLDIVPSRLFLTGLYQGAEYANKTYGTKINANYDNVIWSGSFNDAALGQQVAAALYEKGCNFVYCACGITTLGGFNEAVARREKGEDVWAAGCDMDQYADGLLSDGSSAVLTSTMKNLSVSTYDMIVACFEDKFPGGQLVYYDVNNGGVGIPEKNPNLGEEAQKAAQDALEKIKSGEIVVDTKWAYEG